MMEHSLARPTAGKFAPIEVAMFGIGFAFLLIASMLKLLLGVVALTLACLWAPQRGKGVFIAFVATAFVASSLNELLLNFSTLWVPLFFGGGGYGGTTYYGGGGAQYHQLMMVLMQVSSWLSLLLYVASGVLLVIYVGMRRTVSESSAVVDGSVVASVAAVAYLPACQWDTDLPAARLVSVARRREWGHVIDCLPAVLCWIMFLWVLSVTSTYASNFSSVAESLLTFMLAILGPGFLAYLLFKDSFGGVSLGKWFTGCRVVDSATGAPATVPQTILRNTPFLLFPLGSLIELIVVNFRPDRKRLGDQWAGTMVVHGPPQTINGERVVERQAAAEKEAAPKKHPLDD